MYKISLAFDKYNIPGLVKIHISHQELATKIQHQQIGCISAIRVSIAICLISHYWKFIQEFGNHRIEVLVGPIFL